MWQEFLSHSVLGRKEGDNNDERLPGNNGANKMYPYIIAHLLLS